MTPPVPGNIELSAIGASRGVVYGRARVIDRRRPAVPQYCILESGVEDEVARFTRALDTSRQQLDTITRSLAGTAAAEHLYVLEAHRAMLADPVVIDGTLEEIRIEQINAEWALSRVLERVGELFEQVDDEYLRERAADVDFIGQRVLRNLAGRSLDPVLLDRGEEILIAHDLSPADTAQLARAKVIGFATDLGAYHSHSSIMARSLGLPAVVGLERATELIRTGDLVIIDGTRGQLVIRPDENQIADSEARRSLEQERRKALSQIRDLPAETTDGVRVHLLANIDLSVEVDRLGENGAEGVGLFRTEFLFLGRTQAPDEEEHFSEYRRLVEKVAPDPVTLRTYDLGGDKLGWVERHWSERNPALGLRGIRYALQDPALMRTQLRAMYRAAALGPVRILFPMISGLKEWRLVKEQAQAAREALAERGVEFDPACPLGPMIELPSAAVVADQLARESDFFSIGTNDLIQYLLGVDRDNEHVAELYQALHPAVLRMVKRVLECGQEAGIPVAMCGEMAGDPLNSVALLGLGLTEFSMTTGAIPWVKKILRGASLEEAGRLADELLVLPTAEEVANRVRGWMSGRYPDLF